MSHVGYIRVSTLAQSTERQLVGVELDKVFEEKVSGKNAERPQLQSMLEWVRDGDTVHVHELSRLGRNVKDLTELVELLRDKGVIVKFHKEGLTFTPDENNPMNTLMFNLLSAFSQFERELLLERQREGITIAKAKGKYRGRKPSVDRNAIKVCLVDEGLSVRRTATKLEVGVSTVQRVKKELGI